MQPRNQGGIGPDLKLPLVADRNMNISRAYGVLIEDKGIALRGLFVIDPQGVLRYVLYMHTNSVLNRRTRQITVNDLPVGRSVDETIRLIKAFQFTVCYDVADLMDVITFVFLGQTRRSLPSELE
jgi:alkyl hydroperoxide reductase subunit AhpC